MTRSCVDGPVFGRHRREVAGSRCRYGAQDALGAAGALGR
jgi:hypothetical protein